MKVWGLLLGVAAIGMSGLRARAAEPPKLGADLPWTTYEAEDASTNGVVLGPDYNGHTPQREASGRRCVKLDAAGKYVQFVAKSDAQGLVVRYCIDDSADGRGNDATLG